MNNNSFFINGLDVAEGVYQEVNSIFKNQTFQWEEVVDAQEQGCKVYTVDSPIYEGGIIFKCIGYVQSPSEIPWNILFKVENQMIWDKFCIKSKTIEVYDQLNFIDFLAYASPIAGVPRYFSLFRTCRLDFQNGVHCQVYRSIDHSESAKAIGGNLSGVETFLELKPSGWFMEEIGPNLTKITFITNVPANSMEPYLPNVGREEFKEMYRKSAVHCKFKIPNLIEYIYNTHKQSVPEINPKYHFKSLEIFKGVCDVIGAFDADNWSFFRKISNLECYYKDSFDSNKLTRLLFSDSMNVSSTIDSIQSYFFSTNSHLVDPWTYNIQLIEKLSKETEIYRITTRSVLSPSHEIHHYLLKQVNELPTGVVFIGYKSIAYADQARGQEPFWYLPSGFIITPINSNSHYLVRSITQFDTNIDSLGLPQNILSYSYKRKILYSISEKQSHFSRSLESLIIKQSATHHIDFPHWSSLEDKGFDELVDMFFKMAVSHNKNDSQARSNEDATNPLRTSGSNLVKKPVERKRKLLDLEKTSIGSVTTTFKFSNSTEVHSTLQPVPFTPNWECYIKKKPFLLLVNNKKSLEPAQKLIKTQHHLNQELSNHSFIYLLPNEILYYILVQLNAKELSNVSLTCKLLYKATANDSLWKELFQKHYYNSNNGSIFNIKRSLKEQQQQQQQQQNNPNHEITQTIGISPDLSNIQPNQTEISHEKISPTPNQFNFGTWKKMYIVKESIESNWRNGMPRSSTLQGHESKITCLQFNQDSLLTASRDKELRVWNLQLKTCDTVIKIAHCTSSLISFEKDNSSKFNNELFPYCLYNPEILRLGLSNGQIHNFNLRTQTVESVQRFVFLADGFFFEKNHAYIWESENIQLWDQTTSQKSHNITLDTKIKQFKQNKSEQNFLACYDKTVKVWDTTSNSVSHQFTGHKGIVNCIDFFGDHSLISTAGKNVKLWDIRNTSSSVGVLTKNSSKITALASCLGSGRFTTVDSSNLLVWQSSPNFNDVKLLTTIPIVQEYGSVDALSMDEESIVLGFSKGNVTFLDFYQ